MKRPTHRVIADEYLLHNRCDLNAFGARDTLRDTLRDNRIVYYRVYAAYAEYCCGHQFALLYLVPGSFSGCCCANPDGSREYHEISALQSQNDH